MNSMTCEFLSSRIGVSWFGRYISSTCFARLIIDTLMLRVCRALHAAVSCPLPPSIIMRFEMSKASIMVGFVGRCSWCCMSRRMCCVLHHRKVYK